MSALQRWRERQEAEERKSRLEQAAGLGAATTGGLALNHSIRHTLQDIGEERAVPKTNSWREYLKKLQPGDVIFSREFGKDDRGKAHIYDALAAAKGDNFVHPTVYRGGGMISEAGGADVPAKARARMSASHYPLEQRAYRFKNIADPEKARAFQFLDEMAGTPYKSATDTALHGLGHLAGVQVPTTGKACRVGKDGVVCSELVAEAFPKRFKDRLMSPIDMRHHPDMEMVARYGHSVDVPLGERVLARGVYPVLRNLKWGLGAGALGYAGLSLADYFKQRGQVDA